MALETIFAMELPYFRAITPFHPAHEKSPDAGMDWDDDLQISAEPGGWHAVALTLTGSHAFVEAFVAVFGESMN